MLCRVADASAGETVAHVANRAALGDPGSDLVLSWLPRERAEELVPELAAIAAAESTAATVSLLAPGDAAPAQDVGARGGPPAPLAHRPSPPVASIDAYLRGLAPRVASVEGPLVYVTRAAYELLGPLDESLATSAGAVADLALRAASLGLANLATAAPVAGAAPERPSQDDAAALAERHRQAWRAAGEPPAEAAARALGLARTRAAGTLSVTIDARVLSAETAGTQTYTHHLLASLAAREDLRVRALVALDDDAAMLHDRITTIETLTYAEALEHPERTDVVHRPQQVFTVADLDLVRELGRHVVISQLDLIAFHNPCYSAGAEEWHRHVRATRIALDVADHVIFLSEHARADAYREDLIEPARSSVVALGVDGAASAGAAEPGVPPAALAGAPPAPYMLCLGADYAHKNRPFALALLDRLRSEHGWDGKLVLAGGHAEHGSSRDAEQRLIAERAGLAEHVVDVGHVSGDQQRWLLANAAAVAYPSVIEGFGLVPFEAALAGVPCLFASQSSLAELFPPELATLTGWDVQRSAAAADRLLGDPAAAAAHVEGLRRAGAALTWERCAAGTVEAYLAALEAPARSSQNAAWEARARELEIVRIDRAVKDTEALLRDLKEAIGEDGLALVGPHRLLSPSDQRALLAIATRPSLRRALFATLRGGYGLVHRERE
jgi:glycosyltransferase involved in cell wall biosynthesis